MSADTQTPPVATTAVPLKAKAPAAEKPVEDKALSNDVLTKYQTASTILGQVVAKLVPQIDESKSILELCIEGDRLIEEAVKTVYNKKGTKTSKGIAFPTAISVNNTVSYFSPMPSDTGVPALVKGDVVKLQIGVHIDGYASIHGETLVIGASESAPAEERKADVIEAAYQSAQAAMRLIKIGGKTYDVTDNVQKITKEFSCIPVEGQLSCNQTQGVPDGPKRIVLNPTAEHRSEEKVKTFEEGEVYGVDVLVATSADGKASSGEARTTIYKKSDITYQLKMKNSRTVFAEIQKKAGPFPFNLRCLEEEKRARMGVQEAVQHSLLRPYDIVSTEKGSYVAQFFFTIALLPAGPLIVSPTPVWYDAKKVKSSHSVQDEELKAIIASRIREDKKKAKKAAKAAGAAEEKKE